jgi:hypothetical protein
MREAAHSPPLALARVSLCVHVVLSKQQVVAVWHHHTLHTLGTERSRRDGGACRPRHSHACVVLASPPFATIHLHDLAATSASLRLAALHCTTACIAGAGTVMQVKFINSGTVLATDEFVWGNSWDGRDATTSAANPLAGYVRTRVCAVGTIDPNTQPLIESPGSFLVHPRTLVRFGPGLTRSPGLADHHSLFYFAACFALVLHLPSPRCLAAT